MNKIAWLLLLCVFIIPPVSAYQLYISAPGEINVGQTLRVTGNSTFPVGTSFDLVFYQAGYTATEIERRTVTLQSYNNRTFAVSFPTKGLKGGQYKVEIQFDSAREEQLSSDSKTVRIVQLLDRSGEIEMTSPLSQTLAEALRIEGSIYKLGDMGVQIDVRGPAGPVFGPTWIETQKDLKSGDGVFTKKIPISSGGDYDVHFTDAKGYIGYVTINVVQPTTAPTTVMTTVAKTTVKTTVTTPPPMPTPTQSPVSPAIPLLSLAVICGTVVLVRKIK
ncbi:MAG: hypothetical protein A4E35_02202 [Methanoregula sp. PtaU1.Bin051]|nr:MAG: hypothetical protein A4E35_02202 [Methanoregula sp. PtaU1.Bin051]